jgi:hypothetical protein
MRELIDEVQVDSNGYIRLKLKGELIRCGECKHWDEKPLIKNEKGMTRFGVCRLWHDGYLKADFYCADGERKEKTDGES